MKQPFTRSQPKDGETILHCGHIEVGPFEWSRTPEPVGFMAPDGTMGEARWFVECVPCFQKRAFGPNVQIRGHARWSGDAPIIEMTPLSEEAS